MLTIPCRSMVTTRMVANNVSLLGNDTDAHGCKGSAGYTYCNWTDTCIRLWETNCTSDLLLVGNDTDAHGCKGSAGYTYCNWTDTCIRLWETNCTSDLSIVDIPLVGNDTDAHGCKGSAGFNYCNWTDSCIRPWETNCTGNDTMKRSNGTSSAATSDAISLRLWSFIPFTLSTSVLLLSSLLLGI